MTKRSENIRRVSRDEAMRIARGGRRPRTWPGSNSLTDEDIAAQIAANPDAPPELTDEWFENARLVIPLKGKKRAT